MKVKKLALRHVFLITGISAVLATLAIIGNLLIQSSRHIDMLSLWVDSHEFTLFCWRLTMYLCLFFAWKPYLNYRYKNCEKIMGDDTHQGLLGFRSWLVVAMVVYEVVIVNNALAILIGMM